MYCMYCMYVCIVIMTVRACGPTIIASLTIFSSFAVFLPTSVWSSPRESRDGSASMLMFTHGWFDWKWLSQFPNILRPHTFGPISRYRKVKLPFPAGKRFSKQNYIFIRKRPHRTGPFVRPSVQMSAIATSIRPSINVYTHNFTSRHLMPGQSATLWVRARNGGRHAGVPILRLSAGLSCGKGRILRGHLSKAPVEKTIEIISISFFVHNFLFFYYCTNVVFI